MTVTKPSAFILATAVNGLIVGGIGAAVANASESHPVLKGALAVAALEALLASAYAAATIDRTATGTMQGFHNPRFP